MTGGARGHRGRTVFLVGAACGSGRAVTLAVPPLRRLEVAMQITALMLSPCRRPRGAGKLASDKRIGAICYRAGAAMKPAAGRQLVKSGAG